MDNEIKDCPANYGEKGCFGRGMNFKPCGEIEDCPIKKAAFTSTEIFDILNKGANK